MTEFTLYRYEDKSDVSGTGQVAFGCEFPDGAVAVRWPGDHPSTAAWGDIRDVEAIHGHGGSTVVEYTDTARLLAAYQRVTPFLLSPGTAYRPVTCGPHPDHPDRLRITLQSKAAWRFWCALLEGSTDAATHEEVNGEIEHRWISADGNVWLLYYTRPQPNPILSWESHDDPEVNR